MSDIMERVVNQVKKVLSWTLALVMVLGLVPVIGVPTARAAE